MSDLFIERVVPFRVNDEVMPPFLCTPEHLDDLALGYLLAQGMAELKDVLSVEGGEDGLCVRLRRDMAIRRADIASRLNMCVPAKPGLTVRLSEIRAMCDRLLSEETFFGTHRLMIACEGQEAFREDVGRHNAADKVIAAAAKSGWDFSRCVLGATGRVSLEMLAKAAQMGVPVFFSRKYPSDLSVMWAERLGIAVISRAHTGAPEVYGDGSRVLA